MSFELLYRSGPSKIVRQLVAPRKEPSVRIYKISWRSIDRGLCYWWCRNRDHVRQSLRTIKIREDLEKGTKIEVEAVDFPTRKADIVTWLNQWFTTDNG